MEFYLQIKLSLATKILKGQSMEVVLIYVNLVNTTDGMHRK